MSVTSGMSTQEAVIAILAKHSNRKPEEFRADTRLEAEEFDSLAKMEVVFEIEEHFDIHVSDPKDAADAERRFKTVQSLVELIDSELSKRKS